MPYTVKRIPKNSVEISFEVSQTDAEPFLEDAANSIAATMKIPGFRPGHAPYGLVEKKVGAMKILEEALESIVRTEFVRAVLAEKIDTVGSPHIDVQKLAPGNPIQFSTTVALLPTVTKLADYTNLSTTKKTVIVPDTEVDR